MTQKHDDQLEALANDIVAMLADLKYNAGLQLLVTGMVLDKYIALSIRKYRLNRSRLDVLHVLTLHGGVLKPTDLSKFLFRSKQTITSTVDSLERSGLVKRELDPKDRRTRKVIITRAGTQSIKKTLPILREISNSSMPILSEEEMKTLTATLKRIRKHLLSQIRS